MSETTPETPVETPETPAEAPKETDWKAEARKWEQRAKENHQKLQEAEPIVQQWTALQEASKTDQERFQEESARKDSRIGTLQSRLVSSQITALAANHFADPSDALTALSDPTKYLGLEDEINEQAIKDDLAALLERKPHWRKAAEAAPAAPRVPAPNPSQGSGVNGKASANPADELAAILRAQLGT